MGKTHAKDYLIDYANSINKDWLKCLIIEAINTNGNISKEKLDEIYLNLTENHALKIPAIQSRGIQSDAIIFEALKHVSGINALAKDQTITFSPDVTILHGMNGAGKSSYFRILNEITGGNQVKTIVPNIYVETPDPIDVEIKFKKKSSVNVNTITWNGTNRALPELSKCCVFDSSYLNGFLQARSINEALVLPLGLKLFTYIASTIDEFKERLNQDVNNIRNQKPHNIDCTRFSDEIKNALLSNDVKQELRTKIESYYSFSDDDKKTLESIDVQLKELKQINISDKIALINKTKQAYIVCKNSINSTCTSIKNIIPKVKSDLQGYVEKRENNIEAKKQFLVFDSIPDSNSPEWKLFIQAAHKYHPYKDNTICPYCRQPLQSEESKALLKAYSAFITDKTEEELKSAEQILKEDLKQVESINSHLILSEDVEHLIEGKNINALTLKQYFQQCIDLIGNIKNSLLQALQNKVRIESVPEVPDFKELIKTLDEECDKSDSRLKLLNLSPDSKVKTIESLECQKKGLEEKDDIAKQKDKFILWFRCDEKEKRLQNLAYAMSTADITRLSNKANEELLTEKLRASFIEELKELGKQGLQVELVKAGNSKGKQNTKLILKGNKNVTEILSEGEQKAIGLALFLAEIKSSEAHNPIILDDPVNSLDHQIAGAFAERLLSIDNQVIIFNHNLLFLDSFECSRNNHVCKSGNSACCNSRGKHIKIFLVQDEGQSNKGIVTDYKQNKAINHIKEAEKLLNHSPFEEHIKVSILIRKAVEGCIDEVVFNHQCPTKYSNKDSRIAWDDLKMMVTDSTIIDKLHHIHDRVSGGEMHNGTEASENPVRIDEFRQFINDLNNILSTN